MIYYLDYEAITMPPLPNRHYEHFNKKKMVVAVVVGILILLMVVLLSAGNL